MIGIKIDLVLLEIGGADFFYSFFSTICYNLENKVWGSKYPIIMNNLYEGRIKNNILTEAKDELIEIHKRLKLLSTDNVIWDFDNLSKNPPWGSNISNEITDLSNYYVTSNGEDLFMILFEGIDIAINENKDIEVISI